jgi:hypothetical protein
MTGSDAEKLADLRAHWGSAYVIMRRTGGGWQARPHGLGTSALLRAETLEELRLAIRADYDRRAVPQ